MTESASTKSKNYPPRGGGLLGVPRSFLTIALVWTQLVFALFLFEVPMHLADRFLAKKRGDVFSAVLRGISRWFFRLYPFGRVRRISVSSRAFAKPCVIVANHQSKLDVLLLLTLPANARWLTPRWVSKLPLMGELFKLGKHVESTDRTTLGPSTDTGLSEARAHLDDGRCVLVLPEGHRSRDGRIGKFRNAAFSLAIDAKVPIVPVILEGTGAAFQKDDLGMRSPRLTLRVLEPIDSTKYEGDLERLKADTRKAMLAGLSELREKRGFGIPNGVVTRAAFSLVVFAIVALISAAIYVQAACIAKPPNYTGSRALTELKQGTFENAKTLDHENYWTRTRGGVTEIALAGNAWERGYASARFTPDQLKAQEDHLLKSIDEFLPWPKGPVRWVLKQGIAINNRNLPDYVSEDEKLEILGLVEGSTDYHPDDVPLYHRVLNYHAAHDISHMLIDNPLIVKKSLIGCTGFAVWGKATTDGSLLLARNFDWEAGELFDSRKIIFYVWPEKGHAYVHVAWAGMIGAVSGMNAKGLAVSINAARTSDTGPGRIGTPASLLVKRVLNEAENIEQAVKILREAHVFVSDSYLIASASDGYAVVVEKSPENFAVRKAAKDGEILQANHFMAPEFAEDEANQEHKETATSLYRYERLKELVDAGFGKHTPNNCVAILRDKKGKGGKDLGMGNRNAIDAFICTHSVVMDVTAGTMWVSSGPNTVGSYLRVDVRRTLEAKPQGALRHQYNEEDDLPRDIEYFLRIADFVEFKKQLKLAKEAIDNSDKEKALGPIKSLFNLNPRAWETAYFQGRMAWLNEKYKDAKENFELALTRDPPYEEIREEIRRWLQKASDK
jgi:1-acyl-sn-glycerol-3-phosphate acyltransferase